MRTRGGVEDLVVVDLDDPDEVASRGPTAQRHHFEDRYAELPFGLGTVPRRLDHTPWYLRPRVLAFIAIALIGFVALAGGSGSEVAGEPALPLIEARTHVHLILQHNQTSTVLDVDGALLRPVLPSDISMCCQAPEPTDTVGTSPGRELIARGRRIIAWLSISCRRCALTATDTSSGRTRTIATYDPGGRPLAASISPDERSVALLDSTGIGRMGVRVVNLRTGRVTTAGVVTNRALMTWSRDGRWLFAPSGIDLVAIDSRRGLAARVDLHVPPFESFGASF